MIPRELFAAISESEVPELDVSLDEGEGFGMAFEALEGERYVITIVREEVSNGA